MREAHRKRDTIEVQLDNRQVVSFVIGSVIILGVVFSLGVLVGKQLAGASASQPKPADSLAALDAKEARRAAPASDVLGTGDSVGSRKADAEQTLTFADALTRPKAVSTVIEPTRAQDRPAARADAKPPDKPAVKGPEPERLAEDARSRAAAEAELARQAREAAALVKPPAADDREAVAAKADRSPEDRKEGLAAAFDRAAQRPATQEEGFTLQVSSLPSRSEAERFMSRLSAKGFSPFLVEAEVPGKGRFFRVRVGDYATRGEADVAVRRFREKTAISAIVTSSR
jgi:cell division septation protein DedD